MTTYRYQALGPLLAGEGSRAFLGLAISPDSRARPAVIIWVPESVEQDRVLLEKIRKETEHAAKLDHPNIVTVMGFARLDEGHARVVEFADGESLRKVIEAAKKLPPRIAAKIVCDACTGVHYAHVAGNDDGSPLVHGDLRPETVLLSFGGVTKITGYGALAFAPREIGGQRVKGRRVHSAPEQIIGGREAITIPTDVYLLGLIFYECLTGTVPWADQGDFFDHAVLSLPLPPAQPGLIPDQLEPIITRACSKKAVDRFATPLAMREAIEAAIPGEIASTEELTAYLDSLFPQSHQLRADRRHTIDAGIADFVRRSWADQERSRTTPMMRAVQVPPETPAPDVSPPPAAAPVVAAPPVVAPVAAAARPPPHAGRPAQARTPVHPPRAIEEDEQPRPSNSAPWLILLAVFISVIAGWWAWNKANQPIPGVDTLPTPVKVVDAGPSTPDAAEMAAAAEVSDAGERDAGAEGADAGADDAGAPSSDAGLPDAAVALVAPPENGSVAAEVPVSIASSPSGLEVMLEGKSLGRTPWAGRLPPGRKVFTLQNRELGIHSVRVLTLKNEPVDEKYTFEKGFVVITAPEGGIVTIDGNRIGVAPISGEVPLYEGSHRIAVTVGKSKWSEPFTLFAGQRVRFNVSLEQ